MSRERSSSRRFYRGESYSNLFAIMDRGMTAEEENRWTFEVAWEAANKGDYLFFLFLSTPANFLFINSVLRIRIRQKYQISQSFFPVVLNQVFCYIPTLHQPLLF